jgi:hypothetical protein
MELLSSQMQMLQDLDYFIFCSSSDGRAYEVLSKIDFTKKTGAIALHFKERIIEKDSSDQLFYYKKFKIKNLNEIGCEIKNPSSSLLELEKINFNNSKKIGIDISCLTKPYFYFLIRLFKSRFGISELTVFYTEPQSYDFPDGLFSAFHSSSGPLSVIEIDGYVGEPEARNAKRKLIILLGFDGDLSNEISEVVSPKETIVVNGFPAYSQKFKDISLVTNERLASNINIDIEYARANNPFDTYNLLDSIKRSEKTETSISIAPLGTKPMALGACLFALHNPDVRIMYPMPEKYDDKYSSNIWHSWLYHLPLIV